MTLNTTDTVMYQGKVFYGKDDEFRDSYYRQADDSTIEIYNKVLKNSSIFFKQVSANNTTIWSTQEDQTVFINGAFTNYHIVTTLTGYTDITTINGYDCIRNEVLQTYSGNATYKAIVYVKPGVGLVRLIEYEMNQSPGNLFLYLIRDLVSYKLK